MDNIKKIRSCRRGMANLHKRILPLRQQLKELQQAWEKLERLKYEAELEEKEVKKIPTPKKGGNRGSALKDENQRLKERLVKMQAIMEEMR